MMGTLVLEGLSDMFTGKVFLGRALSPLGSSTEILPSKAAMSSNGIALDAPCTADADTDGSNEILTVVPERRAKKKLAWLTHDEVQSVAADLGVDAKVVMQMEGRMSAHDTPFDAPEGDEDSAYQAPAYYLEDHSGDPARQLEASDWEQDSNTRLATAMGDLDPRSRDILQQRWLSHSKATLHNLADQYQVSAERIRQLEKNAMKKLKAAMSDGMEANGKGAFAY